MTEEKDIEGRLALLEQEVRAIRERNARVEADKAWETSAFRVGFISLVIYATTALVLWLISAPHFLLHPLVPTLGYFLSMQTLPRIRTWWLKRRRTAG